MAHRRGTSGFRKIPDSLRRKKSWSGFTAVGDSFNGFQLDSGSTAGPGGSTGILFFDSASAAAIGLLEGTLIRMRGSILVPKSVILSGAGSIVTAFGIGFVTDEAALAGAVPNPASATGADWDGWMFYRSTVLDTVESNAGILDVKSMRKWNSGMSLVMVAGMETDAVGGAVTQNVDAVIRGLFLLP